MIKRQENWTPEEEWILFLLNRALENKWADIAKFLEGRTDNTIKNHWNSTMKKRIPELQDDFAHGFRIHLVQKGVRFIGCEYVLTNDNGDPKDKMKVKEGYTKEYIRLMREYEQNLLDQKCAIVKEQNRDYYSNKCRKFIFEGESDSFKRASANLMLNSKSEHLVDLEAEYKGKLDCPDFNLSRNDVSVNEQ